MQIYIQTLFHNGIREEIKVYKRFSMVLLLLLSTLMLQGNPYCSEKTDILSDPSNSGQLIDTDFNGTISIKNDSEFLSMAANMSWSGNGSSKNPIIIENLILDGRGGKFGLSITDVSLNFIIRNCTFFNVTGGNYYHPDCGAVYLFNINGTVFENNTISGCNIGLHISSRKGCTISNSSFINTNFTARVVDGDNTSFKNCTIKNFMSGIIFCDDTDQNLISSCNFLNGNVCVEISSRYTYIIGSLFSNCTLGVRTNSGHIYDSTFDNCSIGFESRCGNAIVINNSFKYSDHAFRIYGYNRHGSDKLYGNRLISSSIYFGGNTEREYLDGFEFPSNNTVDGKPVLFRKNTHFNNQTAPEGVGYILLSNVKWLRIENQTINNSCAPISIYFCSHILLRNNTLRDFEWYGIQIFSSDHISIINNTLTSKQLYNQASISIRGRYVLLQDNIIEHLSYFRWGIEVLTGSNIRIYHNRLSNCTVYLNPLYPDIYPLDFKTLSIPINNTINGEPVRYYHDVDPSEIDIRNDTLQLILCNISQLNINASRNYDLIMMSIYNSDNISYYGKANTSFRSRIFDIAGSENITLDRIISTSELYSRDSRDIRIMNSLIRNYSNIDNNIGIKIDNCSLQNGQIIFKDSKDISMTECLSNGSLTLILRAKKVTILNNRFLGNSSGIDIRISDSYTIRNNIFIKNFFSLMISHSINGSINGNIFYRSERYVIEIYSYHHVDLGSKIFNNSFIFNNGSYEKYNRSKEQVRMCYSAVNWSSDRGIGNYWSDWTTPDNNSDGIVDEPYPIPYVNGSMDLSPWSLDKYPLANSPHFRTVTNISAVKDGKSINLSWKEPDIFDEIIKLDHYSLVKNSSNQEEEEVILLPVNNSRYLDSNVSSGSAYKYHIIVHYHIEDNGSLIESGKSTSVNFTLDLDPPTISILSPSNGSYLNWSFTSINWTCEDNISGIDHFEVWMDNSNWTSVGSNRSKNYSNLKEGGHHFKVKAVDKQHNENIGTVFFTVDTEPPRSTITEPKDHYLNRNEVRFTWDSEDNTSGISLHSIKIDGSNWSIPDNSTDHIFKNLSEGTHLVILKVEDKAGNTVLINRSFYIDTISPSLNILKPTADTISNRSSISLMWNGSDSGSGLSCYYVKLDSNHWIFMNLTITKLFTNLSDGGHVIWVKAFDRANNSKELNITLTIDTKAPSVSSYSPTGTNVSVWSNITVVFSENMDTINTKIKISGIKGNLTWSNCTAVFDPENYLDISTNYSVKVYGYDLAGNALTSIGWWFITGSSSNGSSGYFMIISGRLINKDGTPIVGAVVSLDTGETAVSDHDGYFTILTNKGTHEITVFVDGKEVYSTNLERGEDELIDIGTIKIPDFIDEKDDENEIDKSLILFIISVSVAIIGIALFSILLIIKYGQPESEE